MSNGKVVYVRGLMVLYGDVACVMLSDEKRLLLLWSWKGSVVLMEISSWMGIVEECSRY